MDEPAQALHVALAGRGENGAGTEEQQALEDTVIEDVQQGGRQREKREAGRCEVDARVAGRETRLRNAGGAQRRAAW